MGGVKKNYRRLGVAQALATYQEGYAISKGYDSIILKTRNRHKNMLVFAVKSGFEIIKVLTMNSIIEHRIILKKQLS
jgi:ribosomal protein S18 acetylase RimI-like enzyme